MRKLLKIILEFSEGAGPKLILEIAECLLTNSFKKMYADEKNRYIYGVKIANNCIKSMYLGHDKNQCYGKKNG